MGFTRWSLFVNDFHVKLSFLSRGFNALFLSSCVRTAYLVIDILYIFYWYKGVSFVLRKEQVVSKFWQFCCSCRRLFRCFIYCCNRPCIHFVYGHFYVSGVVLTQCSPPLSVYLNCTGIHSWLGYSETPSLFCSGAIVDGGAVGLVSSVGWKLSVSFTVVF